MEWHQVKPLRTRLLQLAVLNIFIALFVAMILWFAGTHGNRNDLPDKIIVSLIDSLVYGFMFGLMVPYLSERLVIIRPPWNWVSIIASLLLIAFFATLIIQLCLLGLGFVNIGNFWSGFSYKTSGVFVIALIIGLSIYTYEKFRERIQATNLQLRTQELEKERALKLATEARLASLESRLHPHFLFNTLNSISALILEDPLLADKMVQRLSTLLRRSLDNCEQNYVTLKEETNLVTDYLEIEKVRFRERLSYSIDIKPELKPLTVPPLVLQPIVENSIKFAVSPRPCGGEIKISASVQNNNLIIEVWDDGQGFSMDMIPRGHGLDNLQSRLVALLGDEAKLLVRPQKQGTVVEVCIPLNGSRK